MRSRDTLARRAFGPRIAATQDHSTHGRRRTRRPVTLRRKMAIGLLLAGCWSIAARVDGDEATARPDDAKQEVVAPLAASADVRPTNRFEVQASDGSILRLGLVAASIPLKTEFGPLVVPVADIRRIDFASRAPNTVLERVAAAIKNLGHEEYKTREAASAELLALGAAAYPALVEAVQSDDPEVVRRAETLLEKIRKSVSDDDLQIRDYDLVVTETSQIAGTIELESLEVDSAVFGRQQVALVMLRRLLSPGEVEQEPVDVLPDPGSLQNFQGQVGKTLNFRVTGPPAGAQQGPVWGTDLYTLDSNLALAAVHAGAVAAGQTKVLGVTLEGPQNQFVGTARNGVNSDNWGPFPGAFKFKSPKAPRRAAAARWR